LTGSSSTRPTLPSLGMADVGRPIRLGICEDRPIRSLSDCQRSWAVGRHAPPEAALRGEGRRVSEARLASVLCLDDPFGCFGADALATVRRVGDLPAMSDAHSAHSKTYGADYTVQADDGQPRALIQTL
jgi:hypothetical protein